MRRRIETPAELGQAVRRVRRSRGLRQEDIALSAGTGARFVGELERGKPTVQLATTLRVLHVLGMALEVDGGDA
ncbi:MAG TPA: helix-turn-helix domain-containing protein [Conexibacter sp.]|nr:helix-turn-helix domain-containing protein [Conexibacter sp.]